MSSSSVTKPRLHAAQRVAPLFTASGDRCWQQLVIGR